MDGGRDETRQRTCPDSDPFQSHGGKAHAAFKAVAGDVEQPVGNFWILGIQRVAKNDQSQREQHAECFQHGLSVLSGTMGHGHPRVQGVRQQAQIDHDGEQEVD